MKISPSNSISAFTIALSIITVFLIIVYFCIAEPAISNKVKLPSELTTECAWCHQKKKLNKHHIIPQSADPRLKNMNSNIVVLCRECHFVLGHRRNWKRFNPEVVAVINMFTNDWSSKDYREMKAREYE